MEPRWTYSKASGELRRSGVPVGLAVYSEIPAGHYLARRPFVDGGLNVMVLLPGGGSQVAGLTIYKQGETGRLKGICLPPATFDLMALDGGTLDVTE